MLPIKYLVLRVMAIVVVISLFGIACTKEGGSSDSSLAMNSTTGKGGSMARFTIVGNYLYVVDNSRLKTVDITTPTAPIFITETTIANGGIETIFPYKGNLFIGSNQGMYIYSLQNPVTPSFLSEFTHIMSCDPVVATDSFAYVTLRSESSCRGFGNNQLDILNITNLNAPVLVTSYPMPTPYGLGIKNKSLFVCHGKSGLGVYDVTNPANIVTKQLISGIETYDLIVNNNLLLVIGPSGFYQYNIEQLDSLYKVSEIIAQK